MNVLWVQTKTTEYGWPITRIVFNGCSWDPSREHDILFSGTILLTPMHQYTLGCCLQDINMMIEDLYGDER